MTFVLVSMMSEIDYTITVVEAKDREEADRLLAENLEVPEAEVRNYPHYRSEDERVDADDYVMELRPGDGPVWSFMIGETK